MKIHYPLKKKLSLKENLANVIPVMLDYFLELSDSVINFPRRKNILHEMRKRGKPLRYAMELGEYCFGEEFKKCLDEIKDLLELMGEIHDVDVMLPEINLHIKEIRIFNSSINETKNRFSTRQMREILEKLKQERREKFAQLQVELKFISSEDFKKKLLNSL